MRQSPQETGGRMRLILLLCGAAVGLLAAAVELVGGGHRTTSLPDQVIARVGERDITLDRYLAVLGDLGADRGGPLSQADREFALQRLIDEELLLLHGMQMGLAESLPEVRKAVVVAVIAQAVAEAEAVSPGERQLRELYETDPAFFSRAARYRVIWLRGPVAAADESTEARQAVARLQSGAAAEALGATMGFERVRELPHALMPLAKMQDYLGSGLALAAAALDPGKAAGPIFDNGAAHILFLTESVPPELPPFDRIRPLVEAEFTRRQGDAALQRQLDRLRQENEIVVDTARLARP